MPSQLCQVINLHSKITITINYDDGLKGSLKWLVWPTVRLTFTESWRSTVKSRSWCEPIGENMRSARAIEPRDHKTWGTLRTKNKCFVTLHVLFVLKMPCCNQIPYSLHCSIWFLHKFLYGCQITTLHLSVHCVH